MNTGNPNARATGVPAAISCVSMYPAPPEAQLSRSGESRKDLARAEGALRAGEGVADGLGGARAVG